MIASLCAFAVVLIWNYPINVSKKIASSFAEKPLVEIETLFEIRSNMQVDDFSKVDYSKSRFAKEFEILHELNVQTGLAASPVVDYLIECERDELLIGHEYLTRSSTAKGASISLAVMPILMWLIGISIGIDIISFLLSWFGFSLLVVGSVLTTISRLIISWSSKQALHIPVAAKKQQISENAAALATFLIVFVFFTSYFGFLLAVGASIAVRDFWNRIPIIDQELAIFCRHNSQHFKMELLAGLVEVGLPWGKCLALLEDEDLYLVAKRINMGVSPEKAFENSTQWQEIGKVISISMQKGSKISDGLRLLANEYRKQSVAYRIQRCEKFAGRLVIPVNLLQLPAFILTGLIPLVGPLFLQTMETFHI